MADILIYWRDHAANWLFRQMVARALFWHSGVSGSQRCRPVDARLG